MFLRPWKSSEFRRIVKREGRLSETGVSSNSWTRWKCGPASASGVEKYTQTFLEKYTQTLLEKYTQTFLEKYTQTFLEEYTQTFLEKYTQTFLEKYSQTSLEKYTQTFLEKYTQTFLEKYTQTSWRKTTRLEIHLILSIFSSIFPAVDLGASYRHKSPEVS